MASDPLAICEIRMNIWDELIFHITKVCKCVHDAVDHLAEPAEVSRVDYHRRSLEIYVEIQIERPTGRFVAREPMEIDTDLESVMARARQQIEDLAEQRKEIAEYVHSMHTRSTVDDRQAPDQRNPQRCLTAEPLRPLPGPHSAMQ